MEPSTSPDPRARLTIVLLLMGLAVLGHFNRVSISVAGGERFIADGLIDEERMGQVYTMFLLVYTASMLPAGWIIDRIGPANALTGMCAAMGACVALTGIVGWRDVPGSELWLSLMFVRGLAGVVSSPLHPGAARTVFLWIPSGARIAANGLVTSGALLGIAATYPVFGWLMDRLGWQWAFVYCGMFMMGYAAVWRFVATNQPGGGPWNPARDSAGVRPGSTESISSRPRFAAFAKIVRDRGLILLSLSYAAVGYFQYMFFYWIEYYFHDGLKLPLETSRRSSALIMVAMAVGMALGGRLADGLCRRCGPRIGRRGMAIGGMLLSSVFAVAGISASHPTWVVIWFGLALASLGACEGVFWTAVTEMGGRAGGLAAAFLNTLGNGGGALAPWLTAVLIRRFHWHAAFTVACVVCALGGLAWLFFDPVTRDSELRQDVAKRI